MVASEGFALLQSSWLCFKDKQAFAKKKVSTAQHSTSTCSVASLYAHKTHFAPHLSIHAEIHTRATQLNSTQRKDSGA